MLLKIYFAIMAPVFGRGKPMRAAGGWMGCGDEMDVLYGPDFEEFRTGFGIHHEKCRIIGEFRNPCGIPLNLTKRV